MQIIVRKVDSKQDLPFGLLLLADETIEAIEKYIYDSDVYVAKECEESEGFAVFALYKIDNSYIEIKNIAVAESLQNNGIGSFLISEIKRIARSSKYENIIVGTPDGASGVIGRVGAFNWMVWSIDVPVSGTETWRGATADE